VSQESNGLLTEDLFRRVAGRLVSALARILGPERLDMAEEVVQDALVKALEVWPYRGVPANPAGWLFTVARHRALDRVRREATLRRRLEALAPEDPAPGWGTAGDDELVMVFLCCHPSLPPAARLALTLKTVGGFSVEEIAAALLSRRGAVAQQLVRAKRRIRREGLRLELPAPDALAGRLESVLAAVYLLFTEGHGAHRGEHLVRAALCGEAIRLGRILAAAEPTDVPAVHALLALMLLQASRLPARVDGAGDLLLLEEQDRSRWDRSAIREGFAHLERAAAGPVVTAYHVEAAIAACHAATVDGTPTDWPRVLGLYDELLALAPSPVVALNRAVALAMVRGPRAGIRALRGLRREPALARYHLLPATLGALWVRAGDPGRAARCYREALRGAGSEPERRFLARRLETLRPAPSGRTSRPRRLSA
jgi:RNA polymerase sigma-70 factor, ECF subfamily